jgi:hypothetical protein
MPRTSSSGFFPLPTATTFPFCDLSLAVSEMMNPPGGGLLRRDALDEDLILKRTNLHGADLSSCVAAGA